MWFWNFALIELVSLVISDVAVVTVESVAAVYFLTV